MAKQTVVKKSAPGKKSKAFALPPLQGNGWLFLKSFPLQAMVVVIVGALFYWNTVKDQYALDDDIILRENMYVQKGISGIGEILSNDAYKSYYHSMGVEQQLSGGRYRPLSVITFALEQSFFGKCYGGPLSKVRDSIFDIQNKGTNDPATMQRLINERTELEAKVKKANLDLAPLRHAFQVFWFVLSMVIVLWFLREHIFRSNTDIAFLSVLLFTIHPIHTEVIANVKSRDEIFSLLFITLTLIFFFRYDISKKRSDLVWGCVNFFLALLSKEYAIVLPVLIPAGLFVFHKRKISDLMKLALPIGGVFLLYMAVRLGTVGIGHAPADASAQDPLNDPYMFANDEEKPASIIARLDSYALLLVYPYPLVSDYSYQHFPYSHFDDWQVWVSLAINLSIAAGAVLLTLKRKPLGFMLLFYVLFFLLVNNVLFDVGATMGERLIYHSSLAFCMIVAWGIGEGAKYLRTAAQVVVPALLLALAVPAWIVTTQRNLEWKDDFTLFTNDVKKHPNSVLCNGNAGARYMDEGLKCIGRDTIIEGKKMKVGGDSVKLYRYADTAMIYLKKAVELHPRYANGFLNLGLAYYYTGDYENAALSWNKAYKIFPSNPNLHDYEQLFNAKANDYAIKKDYRNAQRFLRLAAFTLPGDIRAWNDYAGSSFMSKDFASAKSAFDQGMTAIRNEETRLGNDPQYSDRVKTLQQQFAQFQGGLNVATYNENALNAWKSDSTKYENIVTLAHGFMGTQDFYPESIRLFDKALQMKPGDTAAIRLRDSVVHMQARVKQATPKK